MMETIRCPFLKEEKVAFCKGFPIRKMLPLEKLCLKDNLCLDEAHSQCPTYQEKGDERASQRKRCLFLELDAVLYCEVYPVKKMVPSSAFRLECPCTTDAYVNCSAYQKIAQGDTPPATAGEAIAVRGFSLDDTVYYHRDHIWLNRINGKVRMGLDDFGQWLLGTIEKVILPRQGKHVDPSHPLAKMTCALGTVEIPSPFPGIVVQVNENLCNDSSLINSDPYGQGWLVELRPTIKDELSRLDLPGEGFFLGNNARRWLEEEIDRLHAILQTNIGVTMGDGGQLLRDLQEAIDPRQWDLLINTFFKRKEG